MLKVSFHSDDLIHVQGREFGCFEAKTIRFTTPGGEVLEFSAHPIDGLEIPTDGGDVVIIDSDGEATTL